MGWYVLVPYFWPYVVGIFPEITAGLKYLVGGLEHLLFSHILGIIIPTDFHIFQGD